MKSLHFFIKDLGGDFGSRKLEEVAKTIGEISVINTSSVYSDYFVLAGLAPVRINLRKMTVKIGPHPATLTTLVKLFSYGVVLLEYSIEPTDPSLDPKTAFQSRSFTFEDGKVSDLETLYKTDFEVIQTKLAGCIGKQYDPPPLVDKFNLFIDSKARSEEEIMSILLPGDESYELPKKRRIMKHLNLWEEGEFFFIMGNRGYLYTAINPEHVVYFLELSRVQLYELKIYDYILDQGIEKTYNFLDELPREDPVLPLAWLTPGFRGQVRQILALTEIRMDLVDLVKDITNTSKVTEDPYFELLYRELNETFHVDEWLQSVKEKIEETGDVQKLILGRLDIFKSTTLEITIIILIAIEIVLPPLKFLLAKFGF